eukprot:CAMPEP_0170079082 /NCGR_PEP_ID=MMETSP0019_2-20121128/15552_1 /TAXON_ID=98059 /ORGANISM="Dinobryon sp., Strain UTEXLB2267" /LENGTH=248 /DNA_ID=CAMNT_0010292361 /DNA_START=273 /DNA_END=1019 /DNA_ORIENTATION=-
MVLSTSLKFKSNSALEDHIKYPTEILVIEPATMNALHQIAIYVAREKMQVAQFATDISCMMSPAFSMVYVQELERLETNFQSLPCSFMQHTMLIAKYNDSAVVAFVDMDRRREVLDPSQSVPYISDLIVSPHHRKKGIASALLQRCEHIARNVWKEHHLHLLAETYSLPAVSLYLKNGFVPVSLESGPLHCDDEGCVMEPIEATDHQKWYSITIATEDVGNRSVVKLSEGFVNKLKLFQRVVFRKDLI